MPTVSGATIRYGSKRFLLARRRSYPASTFEAFQDKESFYATLGHEAFTG